MVAPSVPIFDGLKALVDWLAKFQPIVFLGLSVKAFEVKYFWQHVFEQTLENKFTMLLDFIDSLLLFQHEYPDQPLYAQEKLNDSFICGTYAAHNALADVRELR